MASQSILSPDGAYGEHSWNYGSTNVSKSRGQQLFHCGRTAFARAVGGLMSRGWGYNHAVSHVRSWQYCGVGTWSADSDIARTSGLLR